MNNSSHTNDTQAMSNIDEKVSIKEADTKEEANDLEKIIKPNELYEMIIKKDKDELTNFLKKNINVFINKNAYTLAYNGSTTEMFSSNFISYFLPNGMRWPIKHSMSDEAIMHVLKDFDSYLIAIKSGYRVIVLNENIVKFMTKEYYDKKYSEKYPKKNSTCLIL